MTKARFTIVTATAGQPYAKACLQSWYEHRGTASGMVVVQQQACGIGVSAPLKFGDRSVVADVEEYLGVVPAFKLGVDLALQVTTPDGVIACLHDDVLIEEENWDAKIMAWFNLHPEVGLVGFGGGTGLGSDTIYKTPYDPMQLARQDFVSNMRDAEAHGRRSEVPVRVACLDGFSQIGRVAYWRGVDRAADWRDPSPGLNGGPLSVLEKAGVVHHAYDAYLGAFAAMKYWQVYMLPIRCHHYGGQTAVADTGYQEWANAQTHVENGDHSFWLTAHHTVYQLLRGVLPLRIPNA